MAIFNLVKDSRHLFHPGWKLNGDQALLFKLKVQLWIMRSSF